MLHELERDTAVPAPTTTTPTTADTTAVYWARDYLRLREYASTYGKAAFGICRCGFLVAEGNAHTVHTRAEDHEARTDSNPDDRHVVAVWAPDGEYLPRALADVLTFVLPGGESR